MNQQSELFILWRCRQEDGENAEVILPQGTDPHDYFDAEESTSAPFECGIIRRDTLANFNPEWL